jgi:hypothetical protein
MLYIIHHAYYTPSCICYISYTIHIIRHPACVIYTHAPELVKFVEERFGAKRIKQTPLRIRQSSGNLQLSFFHLYVSLMSETRGKAATTSNPRSRSGKEREREGEQEGGKVVRREEHLGRRERGKEREEEEEGRRRSLIIRERQEAHAGASPDATLSLARSLSLARALARAP